MRTMLIAFTVLAAVAAGTPAARSQPMTPGPASMMPGMDKMEHDMAAVPMTGDADRDFVAMMIPHHLGAIDMARYELAHGKDPVLLRLAHAIIAAQNSEIADMRSWQARHPQPADRLPGSHG